MGRSSGKTGFWLVDSRCTDTLLAPFRDAHCFNQVLAAVLSGGVLLGGFVVRLPQLLKIYRARSVEGLSEFSVFVETLGAWVYVGYNILERHPVATWGEMAPVAVMDLLILLLFWKYRPTGETRGATTRSMTAARAAKKKWTFTSAERKGAACLLASLTAVVLYARFFMVQTHRFYRVFASLLGLSPVPLLLLSKIPQIKQNAEQKHTGQLSASSLGLMTAGNLARLYTTFTNLSDPFILLSCSLACLLNAIPLAQIAWYRQRTKQLLKPAGRPVTRSRGKVKAT